jgi:hypothetical protein
VADFLTAVLKPVVSLFPLYELVGEVPPAELDEKPARPPTESWKFADAHGFVATDALNRLVAFGFEQGSDESRFNDEFIDEIHEGVGAWDELTSSAEFDLRAVLRRRRLTPFILIPRHVANRSGTDPGSLLYKNLAQAHEAFVYGAPNAALALMRAVLEAVIRDHYWAEGDNLESRINSIGDRLPVAVRLERLHVLRVLANSLLHTNPDNTLARRYREMDEQTLELEIVSFLLTLRALIEGAPTNGNAGL